LLLVCWIANDVTVLGKRHTEYLATLCRILSAPLLGEIPHLPDVEHQALGQYLDISQL